MAAIETNSHIHPLKHQKIIKVILKAKYYVIMVGKVWDKTRHKMNNCYY
jgi:hypothetical protein